MTETLGTELSQTSTEFFDFESEVDANVGPKPLIQQDTVFFDAADSLSGNDDGMTGETNVTTPTATSTVTHSFGIDPLSHAFRFHRANPNPEQLDSEMTADGGRENYGVERPASRPSSGGNDTASHTFRFQQPNPNPEQPDSEMTGDGGRGISETSSGDNSGSDDGGEDTPRAGTPYPEDTGTPKPPAHYSDIANIDPWVEDLSAMDSTESDVHEESEVRKRLRTSPSPIDDEDPRAQSSRRFDLRARPKRHKMAGRKKLAVINSSLMKEIEFAKEYMTQREKELEESREDVFHKFEAGKESLLKEHCAIKNTMENEFKVERETQQMQLKALMERIEIERREDEEKRRAREQEEIQKAREREEQHAIERREEEEKRRAREQEEIQKAKEREEQHVIERREEEEKRRAREQEEIQKAKEREEQHKVQTAMFFEQMQKFAEQERVKVAKEIEQERAKAASEVEEMRRLAAEERAKLAAQTKDMQKQHEDLAEEERARARSLQKMEMERKEEERVKAVSEAEELQRLMQQEREKTAELMAQMKEMQKQQETALAEKEKAAATALQRVRRENFNGTQNRTPGPSSSANARSEQDVEEGTRGLQMAEGGIAEVRPNGSKDKGKQKQVSVNGEDPKPTGRHARAPTGSGKNIDRRKKDASTKSRTFLRAQVEEDQDQDQDQDQVKKDRHLKGSGRRKDDDSDSDSDSDEEGGIQWSEDKLKKVMAGVLQKVLNQKPPCRGGRKSKKAKTLKDEKLMDMDWHRKGYCDLVRTVCRESFGITTPEDWILHKVPAPNDITQYRLEGIGGPKPDVLCVDMRGKISSNWNDTVADLLLDSIRKRKCEQTAWEELPERSEAYIRELVMGHLERGRMIWKDAQPKTKENGDIEGLDEVEQRMNEEKEERGKINRAYTRRRAKFLRRQGTVEGMIALKEEGNAEDLDAWKWLLELLDHLGEDGMSSEESDVDERTAMEVYYVKEMIWRKNVDHEMSLIDKERIKEKSLYSKKGAKPMSRVRSGNKGHTRRPAPKGRPKKLYEKNWLEGLSERAFRDLEISDEKFRWINIY